MLIVLYFHCYKKTSHDQLYIHLEANQKTPLYFIYGGMNLTKYITQLNNLKIHTTSLENEDGNDLWWILFNFSRKWWRKRHVSKVVLFFASWCFEDHLPFLTHRSRQTLLLELFHPLRCISEWLLAWLLSCSVCKHADFIDVMDWRDKEKIHLTRFVTQKLQIYAIFFGYSNQFFEAKKAEMTFLLLKSQR